MSHELDFLCWLTGRWLKISACAGRVSDLEIASEDTAGILMQTERCPIITLQLNYTDRLGAREIIINAQNLTAKVDLLTSTLKTLKGEEKFEVGRSDTYRKMHENLISGCYDHLCSVEQAIDILKLISAARESAFRGERISNSVGMCWA